MAGTAAGAAKRAAKKVGAAAPTDRKAPARKAVVRRPTAAEMAEMPDAQVETLGEAEVTDDGSFAFDYDGNTFRINSPAEWRQSAMAGLRDFDFNTWARGSMDTDSAELFVALDLTNRQANAFLEDFYEAFRLKFGDDPKELQRRMGLLGRTPARSR